MKYLPIGISTLSSILSEDMVYIDKTEHAYNLVKKMGRYFLSRPRRFGKSLFLDTLKEIFEGNSELFRGLYIYDKWNWEKKYPVIKIDFVSGIIKNTEQLEVRVKYILKSNAERLGVDIDINTDIAGIFTDLIKNAAEKYGTNAVVLVDEYDKPLLDNIEDPSAAAEVREGLKNFYSVLKEQDKNIHFIFLTGVSKFSKVSIFSGINNLKDISLSPAYATVCGYTQNDLETEFAEHLTGVDRAQLREWYNGYNFMGEPVYNPFDILLFISENGSFRNYWFETGTPTFLVKLFKKNRYFIPDMKNIEADESLLSTFDVDKISLVTLLFQTGYLTIESADNSVGKFVYKLKIPNKEVSIALNDVLFDNYTDLAEQKAKYQREAWEALRAGDPAALEPVLKRLFAAIPWRNFTNNDLADYEGYYASVLYAFFSAINCEIIPEDINNHGQADMTIKIEECVYVTEIKVVDTEEPAEGSNSALAQIIERGYAAKYTGTPGRKVFQVGMVFSSVKRNLIQFGWNETAN